jgi:Brp/Blh family beta-carotene 15,15'-monooxygenase
MTDIPIYLAISFLSILILGIPHGALDASIAMNIQMQEAYKTNLGESNLKTRINPFYSTLLSRRLLYLVLFTLSYILLSIVTIVTWVNWPISSLTAFLVISAIHFGRGDTVIGKSKIKNYLSVFIHGGLTIIVIPFVHPDQVAQIFDALSGGSSYVIQPYINKLFYVWLAALLLYFCILISSIDLKFKIIEIILILTIILYCPPAVSFAIYFCVVHSPRHTVRIWNLLKINQQKKKILITTAVVTCLTWIVSGFAIYFFEQTKDIVSAMLQVIFIGLAALTIPHMILVDVLLPRTLVTERGKY